MSAFRHPIHICNRALQHCGAPRIDEEQGWEEDSKGASETQACYDQLREAELRKNTWKFSIRHAILRPIDDTSMLVVPSLWVEATSYRAGAIVSDADGNVWVSLSPDNVGEAPGNSYEWEYYTGPLVATEYDATETYYTGELVYVADGDGGYTIYMARQNEPDEAPDTASAYDSTRTYFKNEVVVSSAINYVSLVDLNTGNTPASSPTQWSTTITGGEGSNQWLEIDGELERPMFNYPQGAGPTSDASTRNVYRLPANFLAKAPQNPKQGSVSLIGAPTNAGYSDWDYEGDYIVTMQTSPINFRFVGNVDNVRKMDALFCEGLACRIGVEICEPVTQSGAKLQTIASAYNKFMADARQKNALEIGAEEDPLDDFLACRR